MAKYIHLTDPYIYPCVCDINDDFFTDFIKKCADKPTNLFYYKNIYLALYDEKIVGLLVAVDCRNKITFAEHLSLSQDEKERLKKANEGYFIPLISECQGIDGWNVVNVCVDADFRRMGIGEGLINFFLTHANERDVYLDVLLENQEAIRLYEKCGFKPLVEYNGFSGTDTPVRCYQMVRRTNKNK